MTMTYCAQFDRTRSSARALLSAAFIALLTWLWVDTAYAARASGFSEVPTSSAGLEATTSPALSPNRQMAQQRTQSRRPTQRPKSAPKTTSPITVVAPAIPVRASSVAPPNAIPAPSSQPTNVGPTLTAAAEYVLSSNDKLRITVFSEPDLSGEFVVDASGNVSFPLIGEVKAAGISLRAFQRSIEAKLRAGYLVEPRVTAEILNFRPFYVLGEVRSPGEYPFASGLTLLNAIAQAGGFTPLANTQAISIKGANASSETRLPIQAGLPISPGDTIRVEKAAIYILGEVKKPGEYPIPPGLNIITAVAQAEGYTPLADTTSVFVRRAGTNNEVSVAANSGQLVEAGDTLRVGKASFFILGEVTRPGEYPVPQGLTLPNAAALAGGFTYRADTRRIFIRRSGETEEKPVRVTNDLIINQGDTIRIAERFF
jgi:protein involved in polysaccharide export with SLBB domain